MRRLVFSAAAGLCLAPLGGLARGSELAGAPAQAGKPEPAGKVPDNKKEEGGCGSHGTSVAFHDTPSEAAARARKDQKLVFVLHVSGNFEDPRFT